MKPLIINKSNILVFDLDDTIFNELKFVNQGLSAVSDFLANKTSIPKNRIYKRFQNILKKKGRGKIFDIFCKENKIYSKKLILDLIDIYRFSPKKIKLSLSYDRLLKDLKKKYNLYIVTDGDWEVQLHKIETLKIGNYFKYIYFTDYFGNKAWKPSLKCFNKIKKIEKCRWDEIVYFGDNPKKDFKNLNLVGAKTFFVSKWSKVKKKYPKIYNANYKIHNLTQIYRYIY